MLRQFHEGIQTRVQNDREYSELFPVATGVKMGCVMTPTLFSMMFSDMLTDAFQDADASVRYQIPLWWQVIQPTCMDVTSQS